MNSRLEQQMGEQVRNGPARRQGPHGRMPTTPPTPSEIQPARYVRRGRWVFAGFLVFALLLLAAEHRTHVLGVLPWLLLLACPLMHLLMHGGHGHHHQGHRSGASKDTTGDGK